MKLIKKNYKFILGILLGVLLFGSGVYASQVLNKLSRDVSFAPTDNNWEVSNVEDALNDLYKEILEDNKFYFIGWKTNTGWNTQALEAGYNYEKYGDLVNFNLTIKEAGTYRVKTKMLCSSGSPIYQFVKNGTVEFQLNATADRKNTKFSYESLEYDMELNVGDVVRGNMYGGGDKTFFITYFTKI